MMLASGKIIELLTRKTLNNLMEAPPSVTRTQFPAWVSTAMSVIFSLLWVFTMLPHTLIMQNFCLVIGASLGFYIVASRWQLLCSKKAIPIWVVLLLFLWMGIHLLFIGTNLDLQKAEYLSLWKRAALGSVFALGFGLSVTQSRNNRNWKIVVLGLLSPTFIYYLKYLATFALPVLGIDTPEYLKLYFGSAEFYVPKISYVFYCLPAFALALGMLLMQIRKDVSLSTLKNSFFWGVAAILVLGVFYLENIKNGIMYALVIIIIFLIGLFKKSKDGVSKSIVCVSVFILLLTSLLAFNNFQTNKSWANLLADLEVARTVSPEDLWKSTEPSYPLNAKGIPVASTNFDRAFYLRTGLNLLLQNPLGYGLVHSSFGHLAKERWPNAPIIQSHSGWLDLLLGLGFPGALLLLLSALMAIQRVGKVVEPWNVFGAWTLGSILILYISTEVAQKNYVDTLVWLIVLVASLGLKNIKID
ncbi:hypothetical protein G6675_01845 [Polynucleobacter paneuropaeus]|nr:hypothetical protein [Polynucleobacter paneuropaeus]MBT8599689.1 hypothetical protein [Polynucleobacter paneuropaeus]